MKMKNLLEENRQIIECNAFPQHNHIVISDIYEDGATGYIDIVPETLNSYGGAHGGAYFTLADTCAAFAARADGRSHVTQSATSNFLRAASSGRIVATAKVVNRSRRFCLISVEVRDDKDKLLFTGDFNYFCVE